MNTKLKTLLKMFSIYFVFHIPVFLYGFILSRDIHTIREIDFYDYLNTFWPSLILTFILLPFAVGGAVNIALHALQNVEISFKTAVRHAAGLYVKLLIISLWFLVLLAFSFYLMSKMFLFGVLLSFFILMFNQHLFHICIAHKSMDFIKILSTSLRNTYSNFPFLFTSFLFSVIGIFIIHLLAARFIYVYMAINDFIWKLSTYVWNSFVAVLFIFLLTLSYRRVYR